MGFKTKKIFSLVLVLILSISALTVNVWARTYPNKNLDISYRPNDNMRIDEFIAVLAHVSYWAQGISGPYSKDKSGNTPADWAAPYVQSEISKGFFNPETINYSDGATIAFAAKYLSNARGLYQWDYVNSYAVKGTDGLSAEEKMYLNVAFDNKLIPYYSGINAKTVLKRKDMSNLFLDKPFTKISGQKSYESDNSMKNVHVFFENNAAKADYQFNTLKKHSNSITQVSFGGVVDCSNGSVTVTYDKGAELEAIEYCHNNGIQTFLTLDIYNFAKSGWSVYDTDRFSAILPNPSSTVSSIMCCVNKYDMDGVNLTFDIFNGDYRESFNSFIKLLSSALKNHDKMLMVSVGAYISDKEEQSSSYDYDTIGSCSDYVHVILYDENSTNAYNTGVISQPGCNSSLVHIDRVLKYITNKIDPSKLLLGTQSFAVAFNTSNGTAENVTYDTSWVSGCEYNSEEGSGHITQNGRTIYFETDEGLTQRALRVYGFGLNGVSVFSLVSDLPYTYSAMDAQSSMKTEIVSAMRENLVPTKYYTRYSEGIRRDEFCDFIVKFIEAKTGTDIKTYLQNKNITVNTGKFSDTSSYNVCAANALGIVSGRSESAFGLEIITRQEAAAMLAKLAELFDTTGGQGMSFSDTDELAQWAKDGISLVSSLQDRTNGNRVMNGVGNGNFAPYGVYTRAQTMMTMVRLYNAV